MLQGNAIVGQSGGPTAAINATLAGVIYDAIQSSEIHTLYGARNGIEGVLDRNLVNLSNRQWSQEDFHNLAATPAALLGSCRRKLPDIQGKEVYEKILNVFKEYNIRYFFYIGGNDSMDTVAKLAEYTKSCGYEICVIGIPKTIDNDLVATHHTPGYGSAAKYVGVTMQEIIRDTEVYTTKAVTIVEIMGRDAGWLTAAAALPRLHGVGPDYIYLPEKPFDVEYFLRDIENAFARHPNVVIAVSEGLRDYNGKYISESEEVDAFGHKMLCGTAQRLAHIVKQELGCKVRSIELNTPQRCASHCASLVDIEESFYLGIAAVNTAISGYTGQMVCMNDGFKHVPATDVANKVRQVPPEFIHVCGNDVTSQCLEYITPLIQGEVESRWANGMPIHFTL